jgi:hypothetical protein
MRLKIASDFATAPGPRRRSEGRHSGEQFREELLAPQVREALKKREELTVDLDGTAGYGTSFLEEAFGGLLRIDGFSIQELKSVLRLISNEEPDLLDEIEEYISDASKDRSQ